ncbi:MAG: SlyX family protein [Gammaproteobacteria bacterium]|nr:MAG: SlyX family protein [Gammaproteobacteria bacterium]
MDAGLIALQERIAHQEAAIEELTRQSLVQDERIRALVARVEELERQLRDLSERVGETIEDAPPPHY